MGRFVGALAAVTSGTCGLRDGSQRAVIVVTAVVSAPMAFPAPAGSVAIAASVIIAATTTAMSPPVSLLVTPDDRIFVTC